MGNPLYLVKHIRQETRSRQCNILISMNPAGVTEDYPDSLRKVSLNPNAQISFLHIRPLWIIMSVSTKLA